MEKYTQDEAIEFECAREAITDLISIYNGQIYEESSKTKPDDELLSKLRLYRYRLVLERSTFHVKDHEIITQINVEYGAQIKAWREERRLIAA